jgi:hypothetical protein
MRVQQYVYFALRSVEMSAAEMTVRLGLEPDEAVVRGSRQTAPVLLPAAHCWRVVCRKPGLRIDEQVDAVIDRLFAHADRLGELAAELERLDRGTGASCLQVVRVFEHPEGEDEDLTSPVEGMQKLPGQHQLLGWHLDARTLEFLRRTRAELDADEYAYG